MEYDEDNHETPEFDNWMEKVDYYAYSDCLACRTARFFILVGAMSAFIINTIAITLLIIL